MRQLPNFDRSTIPAEDLQMYSEKIDENQKELEKISQVQKAENDNIDESVKFYESKVSEKYNRSPVPYERLIEIYHKQKRNEDEIRIIKAALSNLDTKHFVFGRSHLVALFEQAIILREKAKS